MSKRSVELLLEDIIESLEKISRYTAGMTKEQFLGDEKTIDAVTRNLEIIGEAAHKLPDDFKKEHSLIEWKNIVGLRNRIVHAYFGIDTDIIWQITERDLSPLLVDLKEAKTRLQ